MGLRNPYVVLALIGSSRANLYSTIHAWVADVWCVGVGCGVCGCACDCVCGGVCGRVRVVYVRVCARECVHA